MPSAAPGQAKGLKVRARRGYYAPRDGESELVADAFAGPSPDRTAATDSV